MAGNTSSPGVSVTSRALALLACFDDDHRALSLTQLAERADLAVPTAHRLLAELAAWGAVSRRPSGEYVVGRRLWRLGMLAPVQTGLREAAAPFLSDLHAATLATVHLGVRDGTEVLYLDRISGNTSVPVVSTVGSRLPLHSTGVGKVLLAHAPETVRGEVFSRLTRITPYTITQPGRLLNQLERVRREGVAQTHEEMTLGACSVAVPVFGPHQRVVAALGVVVPTLKRVQPRLRSALAVAARGIARTLSEQEQQFR